MIRLKPWEEAIGRFVSAQEGVVTLEGVGDIEIGDVSDGDVGENVRDLTGQVVAILKTDLPDRPYLLRKVSPTKDSSGESTDSRYSIRKG